MSYIPVATLATTEIMIDTSMDELRVKNCQFGASSVNFSDSEILEVQAIDSRNMVKQSR